MALLDSTMALLNSALYYTLLWLYLALLDYTTLYYGCTLALFSLVPRLSCVGGEKRAWYTLFAHAQFSQDFWEFGNFP